MLRDGHVGESETMAMMVIFLMTKIFFTSPVIMIVLGKSAGWALPLIAALLALPGWLIMAALLRRFPGLSLVEIGEEIAGSVVGFGLAIIYFAFFLFLAVVDLRQLTDTVVTAILPETPVSVIAFMVLLGAVYTVYFGLEGLSRAAFLFYPILLAGVVLILLLVIPIISVYNLYPLMGPGPLEFGKWALVKTSLYSELLLLALIAPAIRRPQKILSLGTWSLFLGAAVGTVVVLIILMVFPVGTVSRNPFPLLVLARLVLLGPFFQRLESIFIAIWVISGLLALSICFYGMVVSLARGLKLPVYRPLIYPLVLLVFSLSFLPPSLMGAIHLDTGILRNFSFPVVFGLPALLWLVALIRGKGVKNLGPAKKKG